MFKAVLPLLFIAVVNAEPPTGTKDTDGSIIGTKLETEECMKGDDCAKDLACQNIKVDDVDKKLCIPTVECTKAAGAQVKKIDTSTNIGQKGTGNCLFRSYSQAEATVCYKYSDCKWMKDDTGYSCGQSVAAGTPFVTGGD
jgi:hypothetical protein